MEFKVLGKKEIQPDYARMDAVLSKQKPDRVPLYEIFANESTMVRALKVLAPDEGIADVDAVAQLGVAPGDEPAEL